MEWATDGPSANREQAAVAPRAPLRSSCRLRTSASPRNERLLRWTHPAAAVCTPWRCWWSPTTERGTAMDDNELFVDVVDLLLDDDVDDDVLRLSDELKLEEHGQPSPSMVEGVALVTRSASPPSLAATDKDDENAASAAKDGAVVAKATATKPRCKARCSGGAGAGQGAAKPVTAKAGTTRAASRKRRLATSSKEELTTQLAIKGDYERRSRWKRLEKLDQMRADVLKFEQLIRDSVRNQTPTPTQQLFLENMELRRHNYNLAQQIDDYRHFCSIVQMEFCHSRSTPIDEAILEIRDWWTAPTDAQCHALVRESFQSIQHFVTKENFPPSSVLGDAFGWKVYRSYHKSGDVKFRFHKRFEHLDLENIAKQTWRMRSDPQEGGRLFGFAADVKLCVLKRVDEHTLIVYRQITREDDRWMVRNIYLLFEVLLEDQVLICIRDMNPVCPRVNPRGFTEEWSTCFSWIAAKTVTDDAKEGDDAQEAENVKVQVVEEPAPKKSKTVKAQAKKAVMSAGKSKKHYELDYAGFWSAAASGLSNQFWERELLQAILRWESHAVAPLLISDG
ncbi:TPA: hypothetical protein N0F65_005475 [Lagenidium giganteum]|uniref:Uncharacterized protein n=1 Tax=Lagenidium giganteum TaxID=4803 RepID=A0AAV2YW62_9STRA|nr:TPA: hypothetical protein N0F65_005475 [Lagenidium giganteum]